jgi:subtilase family serine protease
MSRAKDRSYCRPIFEGLETRVLLSGTVVTPNILVSPLVTGSTSAPYTPAQIATAYGFNGLKLSNGSGGTGAGQTIAIVDAYNDPNISGDLKTFDSEFGIAGVPSLKVVNESGGSSLPSTNSTWDTEISLDVEWSHAMAPGANILLVEANSANLGDLLNAVNYARDASGVSVVSMSWGTSEFSSETAYDSYFTTPSGHQGVTFIASSGDEGSDDGPEWPATSPNVLSVGGTTLKISSASGAYGSESAWSDSTGGYSSYEKEPTYQKIVQGSGMESSPDVSYDANPSTGVYVYDSEPFDGASGWWQMGGTSAGAPQWASLIAIANQDRTLNKLGTLNGTSQTIPALFSLYTSASYESAFNDPNGGSSGRYSATQYYDLVTGLGSPKAGYLVSSLLNTSSSGSVNVTAVKAALAVKTTAAAKNVSQPVAVVAEMHLSDSTGQPEARIAPIRVSSVLTLSSVPSAEIALGPSAVQEFNIQLAAAPEFTYSNLAFASSPVQVVTRDHAAALRVQEIAIPAASHQFETPATDAGKFAATGAVIAATNLELPNDRQWERWAALLGVGVLIGTHGAKFRQTQAAVIPIHPK